MRADQSRTIGDWIAGRSATCIVGRSGELSLFERALDGPRPLVIYVHGPGGSGKTTLLAAMRRRAHDLGRKTHWLADTSTLPPDATAGDRMKSAGPAWAQDLSVIFMDDLSGGQPGAQAAQRVLETVPARTLVVLASRFRPAGRWRRAGWEHVTKEVRLGGLSDREAMSLLGRLGVPTSRGAEIRRWAGGSPLVMVLAGQSGSTHHYAPDDDIAAKVMAVVGDGELDPRFHDALQVGAIARTVTPDLLGSVLDKDPLAAFD